MLLGKSDEETKGEKEKRRTGNIFCHTLSKYIALFLETENCLWEALPFHQLPFSSLSMCWRQHQ